MLVSPRLQVCCQRDQMRQDWRYVFNQYIVDFFDYYFFIVFIIVYFYYYYFIELYFSKDFTAPNEIFNKFTKTTKIVIISKNLSLIIKRIFIFYFFLFFLFFCLKPYFYLVSLLLCVSALVLYHIIIFLIILAIIYIVLSSCFSFYSFSIFFFRFLSIDFFFSLLFQKFIERQAVIFLRYKDFL